MMACLGFVSIAIFSVYATILYDVIVRKLIIASVAAQVSIGLCERFLDVD